MRSGISQQRVIEKGETIQLNRNMTVMREVPDKVPVARLLYRISVIVRVHIGNISVLLNSFSTVRLNPADFVFVVKAP